MGIVALAWWVMVVAERLNELYRRPYDRLTMAQDRRSARKSAGRAERNEDSTSRSVTVDHPMTSELPSVEVVRPDEEVAASAADPVTEVLPDAWQPTRPAESGADGTTQVTQPD